MPATLLPSPAPAVLTLALPAMNRPPQQPLNGVAASQVMITGSKIVPLAKICPLR